MLRGQVAWKFFYILCLVGVLVSGCCQYLLDLVLFSLGHLAFLHVAQSGLWDGLRDCKGLVAFTNLNACSFLTVSFCFDCIARGHSGPRYLRLGRGRIRGGSGRQPLWLCTVVVLFFVVSVLSVVVVGNICSIRGVGLDVLVPFFCKDSTSGWLVLFLEFSFYFFGW